MEDDDEEEGEEEMGALGISLGSSSEAHMRRAVDILDLLLVKKGGLYKSYSAIPRVDVTKELANETVFGQFALFSLSVEDPANKKKKVSIGSISNYISGCSSRIEMSFDAHSCAWPGLRNRIVVDHDNIDKGDNLFGPWYRHWLSKYKKDWRKRGNLKQITKKAKAVEPTDLKKWTDLAMSENTQAGNVFRYITMSLWHFLGRAAEVIMLRWGSFDYTNGSGGSSKSVAKMERTKTGTVSELNTVIGINIFCCQLHAAALLGACTESYSEFCLPDLAHRKDKARAVNDFLRAYRVKWEQSRAYIDKTFDKDLTKDQTSHGFRRGGLQFGAASAQISLTTCSSRLGQNFDSWNKLFAYMEWGSGTDVELGRVLSLWTHSDGGAYLPTVACLCEAHRPHFRSWLQCLFIKIHSHCEPSYVEALGCVLVLRDDDFKREYPGHMLNRLMVDALIAARIPVGEFPLWKSAIMQDYELRNAEFLPTSPHAREDGEASSSSCTLRTAVERTGAVVTKELAHQNAGMKRAFEEQSQEIKFLRETQVETNGLLRQLLAGGGGGGGVLMLRLVPPAVEEVRADAARADQGQVFPPAKRTCNVHPVRKVCLDEIFVTWYKTQEWTLPVATNKHTRGKQKEKALFIRYALHFVGATQLRPVTIQPMPPKEPLGPWLQWNQEIGDLGAKVRANMLPWVQSMSEHWHKTPARQGIQPKPRNLGGAYANTIKNLKLIPAVKFLTLSVGVDNATPIAHH